MNEKEGMELYEKSKSIFSEAGFNLRKWSSNSAELLVKIAEEENRSNTSESVNRIGEAKEVTSILNPAN